MADYSLVLVAGSFKLLTVMGGEKVESIKG